MAVLDCAINKKMLDCGRRTGHLPSFFFPTPGDLPAQESPPPGICHLGQKNANSRGSARGGGGWAQVELTDALIVKET